MDVALQVLSTNLPAMQENVQRKQGEDLGGGFAALLEMLMTNLQSTNSQKVLPDLNEMQPGERQAIDMDILGGALEEEQKNPNSGIELLGMMLAVDQETVLNNLKETDLTKPKEILTALQSENVLQSENALQAFENLKSVKILEENPQLVIQQKQQTAKTQQENVPQITLVGKETNMVSLGFGNEASKQVDTRFVPTQEIPGLSVFADTSKSKGIYKHLEGITLQPSDEMSENYQDVVMAKIKQESKLSLQQKNVQSVNEVEVEKLIKVELDDKKTVQMEKEDFLLEQTAKAVVVKDTAVFSGKAVQVIATKLPEELPNIIQAKLQQSDSKEGGRDFIVQLEPKALGKISIKLTSLDGVVSVKVLVEHVESKSLIDNSMQNLKQNLSEQGIKYGRIDVEVGGQFAGQDNQQQQQQQQQQNWVLNGQSNRRYNINEDQIYSEMDTIHATRTMMSNGNVDYLA